MHVTRALAERLEAAEVGLVSDAGGQAGVVMPVGQGVAAWCGTGHPVTKIVGLGFCEGWLSEFKIAESWFAERATPVRVELSSLADPKVLETLSARGYHLTGFVNALGMALPAKLSAPTVEVRHHRSDELEDFIRVMARGFSHPDEPGAKDDEAAALASGFMEKVARDYVRAPSIERWIAVVDGEVAGGASVRFDPSGVVQLCGAATVPELRRRGAQGSLLRARLQDGMERGCDIAVITTVPGSASEANAKRLGFELLYTRALMVRVPPAPIRWERQGAR